MKKTNKQNVPPQTEGAVRCAAIVEEAKKLPAYAVAIANTDALTDNPKDGGFAQATGTITAKANALLAENRAVYEETCSQAESGLGELETSGNKLLAQKYMQGHFPGIEEKSEPKAETANKPAVRLKLFALVFLGVLSMAGEAVLLTMSFQAIAQNRNHALLMAVGLSVALGIVFHWADKTFARMVPGFRKTLAEIALALILAAVFFVIADVRAEYLDKTGGNPSVAWWLLVLNIVFALGLFIIISKGIVPSLAELASPPSRKAKATDEPDLDDEITRHATEMATLRQARTEALTLARATEFRLYGVYIEAIEFYKRTNFQNRNGMVPPSVRNAKPTALVFFFINQE